MKIKKIGCAPHATHDFFCKSKKLDALRTLRTIFWILQKIGCAPHATHDFFVE
jgi:hypothetical protein